MVFYAVFFWRTYLRRLYSLNTRFLFLSFFSYDCRGIVCESLVLLLISEKLIFLIFVNCLESAMLLVFVFLLPSLLFHSFSSLYAFYKLLLLFLCIFAFLRHFSWLSLFCVRDSHGKVIEVAQKRLNIFDYSSDFFSLMVYSRTKIHKLLRGNDYASNLNKTFSYYLRSFCQYYYESIMLHWYFLDNMSKFPCFQWHFLHKI